MRVQDELAHASHRGNPGRAQFLALVVDELAVKGRILEVIELPELIRIINKRKIELIAQAHSYCEVGAQLIFGLAEEAPLVIVRFAIGTVLRLVAFVEVAEIELRGGAGLGIRGEYRRGAHQVSVDLVVAVFVPNQKGDVVLIVVASDVDTELAVEFAVTPGQVVSNLPDSVLVHARMAKLVGSKLPT